MIIQTANLRLELVEYVRLFCTRRSQQNLT